MKNLSSFSNPVSIFGDDADYATTAEIASWMCCSICYEMHDLTVELKNDKDHLFICEDCIDKIKSLF